MRDDQTRQFTRPATCLKRWTARISFMASSVRQVFATFIPVGSLLVLTLLLHTCHSPAFFGNVITPHRSSLYCMGLRAWLIAAHPGVLHHRGLFVSSDCSIPFFPPLLFSSNPYSYRLVDCRFACTRFPHTLFIV